jgi:hypothetical protein
MGRYYSSKANQQISVTGEPQIIQSGKSSIKLFLLLAAIILLAGTVYFCYRRLLKPQWLGIKNRLIIASRLRTRKLPKWVIYSLVGIDFGMFIFTLVLNSNAGYLHYFGDWSNRKYSHLITTKITFNIPERVDIGVPNQFEGNLTKLRMDKIYLFLNRK